MDHSGFHFDINSVYGLTQQEQGLPAPHFAVLATYNVSLFSPFTPSLWGICSSGDFAKGTKQVWIGKKTFYRSRSPS